MDFGSFSPNFESFGLDFGFLVRILCVLVRILFHPANIGQIMLNALQLSKAYSKTNRLLRQNNFGH